MPAIKRVDVNPYMPFLQAQHGADTVQDTHPLAVNLTIIHDHILTYLNNHGYLDVSTQLFLTEVLAAIYSNIQLSVELQNRLTNLINKTPVVKGADDDNV